MMKKVATLILALALTFCLSVSALALNLAPNADKSVIKAGDKVSVTLKLDEAISEITSLEARLYFDQTKFTFDSADQGNKAVSGATISKKVQSNEDRTWVKINYIDMTAHGNIAAGDFATVVFTANADIDADADVRFTSAIAKSLMVDGSSSANTEETSTSVTVQSASPTVALGEHRTMNATVGQEIEVPVYFNNTPTIGMAAFVIVFDSEKLSYTGETHEGGIAEGKLIVAAPDEGENRIVVSTNGSPVTETGRLCTLKFTVKDVIGDAAITFPSVESDDATYPMLLDENMQPVGGAKYSALTVSVSALPQVTAIELDKTSLSMKVGGEETLNATVTADEGADATVTWETENEAVATVENGLVKAVEAGETVITAKAGGKTATCKVTVERTADTGYTVKLSESQSVNVGGKANVALIVGVGETDERTTYNAVDVELKYDSEKLKYTGETTIGETRISDDGAGTLKLVRYGTDAKVGEPMVTLEFTAQAAGKAEVRFQSAKVDESANASLQDAPDATWLNDSVIITVGGYNVTLPDDFEGDKTTTPGEDYTFTAKDSEHYDYTVKATIDGKEVEVIDNGDGSYTIKDENITGDVVITSEKTGKKYKVTITGEDTTGASEAQYGVDYTFKIEKDSAYDYTFNVNAPYVDNGDGTYTIAGSEITHDITINVTKTPKQTPPADTTAITITGVTEEEVVGGLNQTAPNGKDYTITLNKDAAYDYTVKIGETALEPNEDGAYTIPGSMLNGTALTVTVEKTVAAAKVEVFEYLKLKEAAGEESGQSMWLVLVSGKPVNGSVYAFDGNAMFTSEKYDGAYCYLMISGKTTQEVQAEAAAKVSQKAGSASAISYEGDVNGTKNVDINDAQLVYDMYRAKYGEFTQTVAVENFLRADMDGSKNVTVKDAAEIVAKIHAEFPVE